MTPIISVIEQIIVHYSVLVVVACSNGTVTLQVLSIASGTEE